MNCLSHAHPPVRWGRWDRMEHWDQLALRKGVAGLDYWGHMAAVVGMARLVVRNRILEYLDRVLHH